MDSIQENIDVAEIYIIKNHIKVFKPHSEYYEV